MPSEALIFDAIRTPRGKGKPNGGLYEVKPVSLLAGLMRELLSRNPLDSSLIDDAVIGCVTQAGEQGLCIARSAVLMADWDDNVPAMTINRYCASGAEAVNLAAMKIRSGWEELVVAGGVESMSRVPMGTDGGAWTQDPETNLKTRYIPQGVSADLVATLAGIQREQLDEFAQNSHRKAAAAWERDTFSGSVIPVRDRNGLVILDRDEMIRSNCSAGGLARLKPSFAVMGEMGFDSVAKKRYPQVESIQHIHTPGNSSSIVDGAALVLLGSQAMGRRLGLEARARVVATALVGTEPSLMLNGPVPATQKALQLAGLTSSDIDLFEVNEAFAAVVLNFMHEMDIPEEKINVNGGAIAMGHPLGATGAMLINTLLDELEAAQGRYGLVTLCAGGGMAIATIIERLTSGEDR